MRSEKHSSHITFNGNGLLQQLLFSLFEIRHSLFDIVFQISNVPPFTKTPLTSFITSKLHSLSASLKIDIPGKQSQTPNGVKHRRLFTPDCYPVG